MSPRRTSAFSLIEIMVSMTLLSVIVVGLLVVFNHTSRALRAVNNTTDVLEGARATVNFVTHDFSAMAASGVSNYVNLYALAFTWPPPTIQMPDGSVRSNILHDCFLVTRENDRWMGVGYFLDRDQRTDAVGTLYRFDVETNGPVPDPSWFTNFIAARVGQTNVHRIADGVVHFELTAFYENGRVYPPPTRTNDLIAVDHGLAFRNKFLPAHVELEIGLMEPETTRKFNAIDSANAAAARSFLMQQAGKMHLFRQRIAIRNHSLPPAFN